MAQFPRLLEPITIGSLRLPKRLVIGETLSQLDTLNRPIERQVAFFARRTRGGKALLITNGLSPNPAGRMDNESAVLDKDAPLDAYRRITEALHVEGGCIALQLLQAGCSARHEGCLLDAQQERTSMCPEERAPWI